MPPAADRAIQRPDSRDREQPIPIGDAPNQRSIPESIETPPRYERLQTPVRLLLDRPTIHQTFAAEPPT